MIRSRKLETCDDARTSAAIHASTGKNERPRMVVQTHHNPTATTSPTNPLLRLEYFEIVDPATMQPVEEVARPVRVAAAMWVGTTRLIDNILVS